MRITVRVAPRRYDRGGLESSSVREAAAGQAARSERRSEPAHRRHGVQSGASRDAQWMIRLIAEEAVKRKLAPEVGREMIRIMLQSRDLKPWREIVSRKIVRSVLYE